MPLELRSMLSVQRFSEKDAFYLSFVDEGDAVALARFVDVSQADLDRLFGPGYELTKMKDLSQPGQYACKEMVTVCGPKGAIEKVRILGPVRRETQVEILAGDGFKLGVKAPVRLSGDNLMPEMISKCTAHSAASILLLIFSTSISEDTASSIIKIKVRNK